MKKALHFGAGKIGRGFLGVLLHDTGYHVVFADVSDDLVGQINRDHQYSLFLINQDYKERVIDNVSALSTITQREEVLETIAEVVTISTSIMFTNLPKIAPLMAEGLKRRVGTGREKVMVITCENAIMGTTIFRQQIIDTGLITAEELDSVAVFPNVAVDRMVFDSTHGTSITGVDASDAFELAVERLKLPDPDKEPIKGAEYVDDLEKFLHRKIYMINCGHAVAAYLGHLKGYTIVQDAFHDPEIYAEVRETVLESAAALEKKYGFSHESLVKYMNDMILDRYTTPGISDPLDRVAREPIRKISPNDRFMGPAHQCEEYGLENRRLLRTVACAMKYVNPEDAQAVELQKFIAEQGVEAAVAKYTGLKAGDRMFQVIVEEYSKLGK